MNGLMREFGFMLRRLGRDEEGVALMLTLSVILLLYVLCAGLYVIGEDVRIKVELQNACDSAAYSAAVAQADGLSRMAMVNRALSWSYVQLTNMQMDYISYKWLREVHKRFCEDRENCRKYNDGCSFSVLCPDCGDCEDCYMGQDRGWFCGVVGAGCDRLNVNGHVVALSEIESTLKDRKGVLSYGEKTGADGGEYIQQFKRLILSLNYILPNINRAMIHGIYAAGSSVLHANLPREVLRHEVSTGEGEAHLVGEENFARGQDYVWLVRTGVSGSPYEEDGLYFDPLFNTELDERLFLSMADGDVHDNLVDYFYSANGFDAKGRAGGLDQWFVRSWAGETEKNETGIMPDAVKSYRNLGICRVYKNSNRIEGGKVSRGHHTGVIQDTAPSCQHKRASFPEQCATVPDGKFGLYADYEWGAVQVHSYCWVETKTISAKPPIILFRVHHIHTGSVLDECDHFCCSSSSSGHTRIGYDSCYIDTLKKLAVAALPCDRGGVLSAATYTTPWYPDWIPTGYHPEVKDLGTKLKTLIYGFSRTYGDDSADGLLYDAETFTGVPAQPWILNEKFYQQDGTIVVGLARRRRNPWVWLLNSIVGEGDDGVAGIYSAFDLPGAQNYTVALSAARAAHRFNPSARSLQYAASTGGGINVAGSREYEPRYDAVCADDMNFNGYHPTIAISPGGSDAGLRDALSKARIGCVCGKENARRFARCWNLCETDWDAMLLPLRYAWADASPWHDSLNDDAGKESEVVWETVDEQNQRYASYAPAAGNVFRVLSAEGWNPFYDENGELIVEDEERVHTVTPVFLRKYDPDLFLKAKYL